VTFDGLTTFFEIADDASLRFGTGPFAIFAVVRGAPASVVNAMIYQKSEANDPWAGPALLVNANKPADSSKAAIQLDGTTYALSPGAVADTTPRLLSGRRYQTQTGTELELRLNGSVVSTAAVSAAIDLDAVGRNAIIGHNGYTPSSGFQAYAGEISELCAVKGALTPEELAGIEAYLLDKYALP
jgi:hypothetical protein